MRVDGRTFFRRPDLTKDAPPVTDLLLANCSILDVESGAVEARSIRIEGDTIAAVGAGLSAEGCTVVDMAGAHVMPGLISCHTHLTIVFPFSHSRTDEDPALTALRAYSRARDALNAGVTTIRTVGEINRADIALRQSIKAGWVVGPRIYSAGYGVSTTGGHGHSFTAEADGADDFLRKCRLDLLAGADHVKIFLTGGIAHQGESLAQAEMIDAEINAAVAAARRAGTYVAAHAGAADAIAHGVSLGITCFEHAYEIDREAARAVVSVDGFVVPTLCVTRSPAWMRDHCFEHWTIEKALSAAEIHRDAIRIAFEEGVTLVNGTDIPPGDLDDGVPVVVREMENMLDIGMTPLQAIQTTTINASRLLRAPDIGHIRPGAKADLLALGANPAEDLSALHAPRMVMIGGRVARDEDGLAPDFALKAAAPHCLRYAS